MPTACGNAHRGPVLPQPDSGDQHREHGHAGKAQAQPVGSPAWLSGVHAGTFQVSPQQGELQPVRHGTGNCQANVQPGQARDAVEPWHLLQIRWRPCFEQRSDQNEIECHVDDERDDAGAHRRFRVLARVERRQQRARERDRRHAGAKRNDRNRRHVRIERGVLTVLEKRRDQRLGKDQQGAHRRHRDQQSRAQAPVQRARKPCTIFGDVMPRQRREDHGAERDAEHAQRQFEETRGLVHPGLRAGGQQRDDDGVEQQVQLRDG